MQILRVWGRAPDSHFWQAPRGCYSVYMAYWLMGNVIRAQAQPSATPRTASQWPAPGGPIWVRASRIPCELWIGRKRWGSHFQSSSLSAESCVGQFGNRACLGGNSKEASGKVIWQQTLLQLVPTAFNSKISQTQWLNICWEKLG